MFKTLIRWWIQVMGLAIVPCVSPIFLEDGCLHMAPTSPRSGPSLDPPGTFYHFLTFPQKPGSSLVRTDQAPTLESRSCTTPSVPREHDFQHF